jgi:hypothetical protein
MNTNANFGRPGRLDATGFYERVAAALFLGFRIDRISSGFSAAGSSGRIG